MNLYESIGTHSIELYVNAENVTYFESFGIENIPKENSWEIKMLKQIFVEYKHMSQ